MNDTPQGDGNALTLSLEQEVPAITIRMNDTS